MLFSERLSFLMTVLNVTNIRLARALSVDASLVSRWRAGTRTPGKNSEHIKTIAAYFAGQATMDYQKAALCETIGVAPEQYSHEPRLLAELLLGWLAGKALPNTRIIDRFIGKLDMFKQTKCPSPADNSTFLSAGHRHGGMPLKTEVFYGIKGKQAGVFRFLSAVAAHHKPCTLLLYSDENIEWFSGDREFLAGFVRMLTNIIARGHKIKIIHNLSRDMVEMFAAIDFWLPFYLSGAIEPYYCPKYREHYFRRTIFIAPGIASLTSTTLAGREKSAANLFCVDPGFLDSLTNEFNDYLAMCRPLMHIFTNDNPAGLTSLLAEFAEQPGHSLVLSSSLTTVTMPDGLFERLLDRTGIKGETKENLLSLRRANYKSFITNLENHTYTEIVSLPSPEEMSSGQVPVESPHLFSGTTLCYSLHEYKSHLENIVRLLRNVKNFRFYPCRRRGSLQNIGLTVKDEVGVIVTKTDPPATVFAFNQPNMTNAFYCYLEDIISSIPHKNRDRQEVIRILNELSNGIISAHFQNQ